MLWNSVPWYYTHYLFKLILEGDPSNQWVQGYKCPCPSCSNTITAFEGNYGYDYEYAKTECASKCDNINECLYADLYYAQDYQTCYLRVDECGDWKQNTISSYSLYIKGIVIFIGFTTKH